MNAWEMKASKWLDDDRPRIASEWTIEEPVQGVFYLRSESATKILRGQIMTVLLPLLNGRRSVGDLLRELGEMSREKVITALESLERENLVMRQSIGGMARAESAYWRLLGADESKVPLNRAAAVCSFTALDDEESNSVEETLATAGIRVTDRADFRLIVARDVLDPRLAVINQECLRSGANWMLVRPYGLRQWLGPLFIPGKTPCWECLLWWLRSNGWAATRVIAEWAPQTRVTLALAAIQAAKWLLTGHCDSLVGRIREFDSSTLTFTEHCLLRSPVCSYCAPNTPQPVDLNATASALTGVTARLQVMREWPGLAVYAGQTSQIVGFNGVGRLYYCRSQSTFGVAESSVDARTVCLAEGVERYSVRFGGFERVVKATYRELGAQAVHPAQLTLQSDAAEHPADGAIGWVPAVSLITSKTLFVPAGLVYLCFDERFQVDTNGCASGNTLEAATLSALLS